MSKLRWAKWFWADWSNDTALNLCSIPARGLWMSLLCIAAQGEPYGTVTIKGRVPTTAELFSLIAPRGTRRRDFDHWLAELEDRGVAQRDHRRALWSPRMSHSGTVSLVRNKAATSRWKSKENRQQATDLHMQSRGNGAGLHKQKEILHGVEAEAESEAEPPMPPKTEKRRRGKQGDPWTYLAKRRVN